MKTTNVSVISFQGNLIDSLKGKDRLIAGFINLQESESELAVQRFGQEITTNLLPKSLFARGLVDLCDNAFREILENIIVYLGPKFLGENIFRKAYAKNLKDAVVTPAAKLMEKETPENKTLMPIKAAIAVGALGVPLAEYSLSYMKNLFTLKLFNQANFNNIANLNKDKIENEKHHQKVKENAKKHIALAGGLYALCLGLSALLATKGKNSAILKHFSEAILAPGSKIFKNNENAAKFFNKYFGLDFNSKKVIDKAGKERVKLSISNGQITACVIAALFGYTGAAKDRGKQDYKEVLYRLPLVGLYAICGNELFNIGFKKFLKKTNRCKEIFEAEAENIKINQQKAKAGDTKLIEHEMPRLKDLPEIAKKLALKNGTTEEVEFRKLFRQKTALIAAPALFGFFVMGMFVAAYSRYFTQYRYNQDLKKGEANGKPAN